MTGRSRTVIAVGTCCLLVLIQPAWLDAVRYPLALVISWPGRELASALAPPEEFRVSDAGRAARALWTEHRERRPERAIVRVIRGPGRSRYIVVALGHGDGARRGAVVSAEGHFVGVIDRVERRLSRVRLASHADCTYGGAVIDEETGLAHEVLLKGDGRASATTEHGSRLPREHVGVDVMTRGSGTGPWLRLGNVAWDDVVGETVVELGVDPERLDWVAVTDPTGGAWLGPPAERLHETVAADVLAAAEAGSEARSLWISRGLTDDVVPGSWVSRRGELVGRVVSAGPWTARVRPFVHDAAAVDLVRVSAGLEIGFESSGGVARGRAADGSYFTRGRSRGAGPPRGLWAFTGGAREAVPGRPRHGDVVYVHVFVAREELTKLTWGLK